MGFRFSHGDRPLDGFTILRGLGRGGFGEVYYAVSDGGREVALKVIQQNHDIELRGVRHCMNLKSPHLVCIFDVRHDDQETPYVVMEYVSGPSLRAILSEHGTPSGLGVDRSAWLVLRVAEGLAYLHEKGIVHRDLKPENIFVEDGYAKIGDYGLSKFINVSRQSGQTISVGTVHYMAPEIGSGNYSRGIDIYSLGVMFYEMLTGRVPFEGDSMAEILMKHLTSEPDLSSIEASLRPIIARALRKRPEDRYGRIEELVEELEAVPGLRERVAAVPSESFAGLSPAPRTALERLADAPTVAPQADEASRPQAVEQAPGVPLGVAAGVAGATAPSGATAPASSATATAAPTASVPSSAPAAPERVPQIDFRFRHSDGKSRLAKGAVTCLAMALAMTLIAGRGSVVHFFSYAIFLAASTAALLAVEGWAAPRFQIDMGIARRMSVLALTGPVMAVTLSVLNALYDTFAGLEDIYLGLFGSLVCVDWNWRVQEERRESVSLEGAFFAGVTGLVLGLITGGPAVFIGGTMAALSLALNAVAPARQERRQSGRAAASTAASGQQAEQASADNFADRQRAAAPSRPGRLMWKLYGVAIVVLVLLMMGSLSLAMLAALTLGGLVLLSHSLSPADARAAGWKALGSLFVVGAFVVAVGGGLAASPLGEHLATRLGTPLPAWVRVVARPGSYYSLALVAFLPGILFLLIGRRTGGAAHVLRGAIGWAGIAVLTHVVIHVVLIGSVTRTESGLSWRPGPVPIAWLAVLLAAGTVCALCIAWPERDRAARHGKA